MSNQEEEWRIIYKTTGLDTTKISGYKWGWGGRDSRWKETREVLAPGHGGGPVLSDLSKEAPDSLVSAGHNAAPHTQKAPCVQREGESKGQNARREARVCSPCCFPLPAGVQCSGKKETKATTNTSGGPLVRPAGVSQGWPGRVHPAVWRKKDRLPRLQGVP